MVKTIKIFDNLRLFNLISNLRYESKIFYLKKSADESFIIFLKSENTLKKLNWKF